MKKLLAVLILAATASVAHGYYGYGSGFGGGYGSGYGYDGSYGYGGYGQGYGSCGSCSSCPAPCQWTTGGGSYIPPSSCPQSCPSQQPGGYIQGGYMQGGYPQAGYQSGDYQPSGYGYAPQGGQYFQSGQAQKGYQGYSQWTNPQYQGSNVQGSQYAPQQGQRSGTFQQGQQPSTNKPGSR